MRVINAATDLLYNALCGSSENDMCSTKTIFVQSCCELFALCVATTLFDRTDHDIASGHTDRETRSGQTDCESAIANVHLVWI